MKNTIRIVAIIAAIVGFFAVSTPASAYGYRRHHRRGVVYVSSYAPYGYYGGGYGYYPSYAPYYGAPYYYGRPYYRRPVISFGIGF